MGYFDSIYSDDSLPHRAKAVYMYLRDRMDSQRQCWPGIRRIAGDLWHGACPHRRLCLFCGGEQV